MQIGDRLGPYEIVASLGAGGMGEVYRAHDARLDRDVAIKVLPAAVSENPDALARFDREAKAVAALSHPNILALHDLGEHEGVTFAVMELLEGGTLRDALAGGALPLRKAVEYARQAARGLGAAHDNGIVHRDVKPENLFVTRDGRIKILDFGLARAGDPSPAANEDAATRTSLTEPGTVLGTVNYMSPEQTRGEPAGEPSDIFSLGTVLYEMLTGKRPFERETAPETMTAILREDPPAFDAVPPGLQRIVLRCLEKEPTQRFHAAQDLAFALESSTGSYASGADIAAAPLPAARPRLRTVALAAAGLALGLAAGWWAWGRPAGQVASSEPVRIRPLTFSGRDTSPTVSPDGRMIAFASRRGDQAGIWIKQLNGSNEAALTQGKDDLPRFSPDGSSLLFLRDSAEFNRSLYRVPVVGGSPRKIVDDVTDADWSADGTRIVYTRNNQNSRSDLRVVNADGTEDRELWSADGILLVSPRWSPDGKTVAFLSTPLNNYVGFRVQLYDVAAGSVRDVPPQRPAISGVSWTGDEELIFGWSDDLLAGTASTTALVTTQNVRTGETRDLFWTSHMMRSRVGTQLDVVGPGTVVFGMLPSTQNLELVPIDPRSGEGRRTLTSGNSIDRQPSYHPDGETILFSSNRTGNLDLWTLNTRTGETRQLTDDDARDWDPAFTADGEGIIWSSDRSGNLEIWMANADGSAARQVTSDGVDAENPSITPDGEWVVYVSSNPEGTGLWKIRSDGTDATRLVAESCFIPEMSPDGRYVAYAQIPASNLSRVRVLRLSDGGITPFEIVHTRISDSFAQNAGRSRWSADGKTIYYTYADATHYGVVSQAFDPTRPTDETMRYVTGFDTEKRAESFDVSPDGKRLVVSWGDPSGTIMLAENVPYVTPPRR